METTNDPRFNFYARPSLYELVMQQGKRPIVDISELQGNFWPDDEPIEEFLSALREWRGHRQAEPAA